MKLDELTPDLLRRAVALYTDVAYDGAAPPASAAPDLSSLIDPADVLALFTPEQPPNPGGEQHPHYVLRLGNRHYPHMKIALMEFCEPGEWFFSVDTHDLAPVDEGSAEWDQWLQVRRRNLAIKRQVERAWRTNGLPTARVVAAALTPASDGSGPLVLVVDDERGMRMAAVNILRHAGYRVVEAGSGAQALMIVEDLQPNLVLMDYEMPGLDGIATCRAIRRREREQESGEGSGRHQPVLLATAGAVALDETSGADGFLMKPYHRTLLLSFVRHLLPGKKGPGGGADSPGP